MENSAAKDQLPRSEFADYLTFKLDLLKEEMLRDANQLYRQEVGLDVRSLRLLRAICDNPGVTATGLRELTLVEKTTLSKVLAELHGLKLIHRTPHRSDARLLQLWPTPLGEKLREQSDVFGHALESSMLSVLTQAEQKSLNRLLDKLTQKLLVSRPAAEKKQPMPSGPRQKHQP